ncbi:MAG: hypothetical protein OCC49_02035 [Fibrobacterales bacterium]
MYNIKNLLVAMVVFSSMSMAQNIGITWVGESGMARRVNSGLSLELSQKMPSAKITFKNELKTLDEMAGVIKGWEKSMDAIVVLRSNGAKWLAKNKVSKPVFIGGCNNPVQLGTVSSLDKPGGSITGVTYYIPVEKQFETFTKILPDMKKIVLLVEKGHPSSTIDINETKAVAKKRGMTLSIEEIDSKLSASKAVAKHKDNVDAIILGNQAKVFDNAFLIVETAGKTPTLSFSGKPVKMGALAGLSADDTLLGQMLAQSVMAYVKKEKAMKDIPIKTDQNPLLKVNPKTAKKLGIAINQDLIK